MKCKALLIITVASLIAFGVSAETFKKFNAEYPFENGDEWFHHMDDWRVISPDAVSVESFYKTEYAMIAGYSGAQGYFLDKDQISWLVRAIRSLARRGILVQDHHGRKQIFRNSFYHMRLEKAAAR